MPWQGLGAWTAKAWAYLALVWAAVWKHSHLLLPWHLYLGSVEDWDGRNWANLESFLLLPTAGLVLWAVRKSDGIPFSNFTLDCACAGFQELLHWQTCWESFRYKLDHAHGRRVLTSRLVQAGLELVFKKKSNPTYFWKGEEYKPLPVAALLVFCASLQPNLDQQIVSFWGK